MVFIAWSVKGLYFLLHEIIYQLNEMLQRNEQHREPGAESQQPRELIIIYYTLLMVNQIIIRFKMASAFGDTDWRLKTSITQNECLILYAHCSMIVCETNDDELIRILKPTFMHSTQLNHGKLFTCPEHEIYELKSQPSHRMPWWFYEPCKC